MEGEAPLAQGDVGGGRAVKAAQVLGPRFVDDFLDESRRLADVAQQLPADRAFAQSRARGMASYQMAIMGSSALGAALWGQVATVGTMQTALFSAAASGTLLMLLAVRFVSDSNEEDGDMSPARSGWAVLPTEAPPESGRVVTTVEYIVDPERAEAFIDVMQLTRRARLSEGAIGWELLRDIGEPARFVEEIVDESWTEHLRRFHRATAADIALRERRLAFHQGEEPPVITRYVARR